MAWSSSVNWGSNNCLNVLNLRTMVARKATRLLWGEGFTLSSEDEKINEFLTEFQKDARLQFLFEASEKMLSGKDYASGVNYGRTVMTIDKTVGGKIKLAIADPRFINKIGMAFLTENLAVLWKKIYLDDKMLWLRQTYDDEKVVASIFNNPSSEDSDTPPSFDSNDLSKNITIQGYNQKVPADQQVQEVWKHGMGICPVIQFVNLPDESFIEYYQGFNPDDIAQGNVFQNTLTNLIENYNKIMMTIAPKLAGHFPPETMAKIKANFGTSENFAYANAFFNTSVLNSNGESEIHIIEAKTKLDDWMVQIRKTIELYFNASGYSFDANTDKSDLTATGSLMGRELDIITTKAKRDWRTTEVNRLIRKVLIAQGFYDKDEKEDKFVFKIKTNILINTMVEAQTSQLLIQTGISTRVMEIAKIHNISPEAAQEMKREIDKEQKADAERQALAIESAAPTEKKNIIQEQGQDSAPNNPPKKDK